MSLSIKSTEPSKLKNVDYELNHIIKEISERRKDNWAFSNNRGNTTSLYQYPAMMVPEVQREVLDAIIKLQGRGEIQSLFDPFIGSGTTALEGMYQGLSVYGQDINPLAILLCKVRTDLLSLTSLEQSLEMLKANYSYCLNYPTHDFPGISKWYSSHHIQTLSKLRYLITYVKCIRVRRFMWVCLAETSRIISNSRQSTFKLHIKKDSDILNNRKRDALSLFYSVYSKNIEKMACIRSMLSSGAFIRDDVYTGGSVLLTCNNTLENVLPSIPDEKFGLLVTSPPYGDNLTTVPYGQSSFLPLRWINIKDIDLSLSEELLRTTQEIDRRSLGGKVAKKLSEDALIHLLTISPTLKVTLKALESCPIDRYRRVLTFFNDLEISLSKIVPVMNCNSYSIWTVGNRHVGGIEIPTHQILLEFLSCHNFKHVLTIKRPISLKKMAARNSISQTIHKESILVFRKEV